MMPPVFTELLGKQGYIADSGELEFQASSSQYPCPLNRLSSGVPKKINSLINDSCRRPSVDESYQMSVMHGTQRIKRQNCGSSVHGHWHTMNGIYESCNVIGSVSNRARAEMEGILGHCSMPMFGATDKGNGDFNPDYVHRGPSGRTISSSSFISNWTVGNANLEAFNDGTPSEDRVDIWKPDSALQFTARSADLGATMAFYTGGLSSLVGHGVEDNAFSDASFVMSNGQCAVEGRSGPDLSPCAYSSLLADSEGRTSQFRVSDSVGNGDSHAHVTGKRRSSCKRKSPMVGITSSLPFGASHFCGRWQNDFSRSTIEGAGPSRSNMENSISAVSKAFQTGTSAPMIRVWSEPQYLREGTLRGGDIALQSWRGRPSLHRPSGSSDRYVGGGSSCMQQEQCQLQLYPLLKGNRRILMKNLHSRIHPTRMLMNEQHVASAISANNIVLPDLENRSALPSSSLLAGTWFGNRANTTFGGPSREIISGILPGNQTRNGASSWLGFPSVDSRFLDQTFKFTGRAISAFMGGALDIRESYSHVPRVGAPQLVYPGSIPPRPSAHLSTVLSSRCNAFPSQGLPPATSGSSRNMMPGPPAVSEDPYPSSASLHDPCPSAMPSFFLGGPGEGDLPSSMQNLFHMPFRGVQIVPTEGGNRQHFASEELLDQSVELDIHDQHSDMRLDVDNMSYEELLALEERIGIVNTGLSDKTMEKCLKTSNYSSSDFIVPAFSQESENKCSICQEEYMEEDEVGTLHCGHSYHTACIKQWLMQKNQCPICKTAAYSEC